ncbi:MAG: hypothetical protein IPJ30_14155 [Acidobacteria bacterium]|nr:hypothetical protein [Acidobacteriota bacterium]
MQDWQGSVRAGVNASGFVKSRTDHQAFGEPIASGIGLRTTAQGFGVPASNRQGYGLTEKDSTGLNHTWFRKNENRAGRWTSPDPYNGSASVGNPQSWNRYSYVESQPTNYVDPSGLRMAIPMYSCERVLYIDWFVTVCTLTGWWIVNDDPGIGTPTGEPGGGVGGSGSASAGNPDYDDCVAKVEKDFSKPPAASEAEIRDYNLQTKLARDLREIAIDGGAITTKEAIFWGVLAVAAGAAIGAYFGAGIPGAIVGAVVGAGFVIVGATRSYIINETQAWKAYNLTMDVIRKSYPNAVKRDEFFADKRRALQRCDRKYKPKRFWDRRPILLG